MTAMLETVGLGKRYRRRLALSDCTLSVPAGKVVGLVGPNGAGKSTLLHLAVGLLSPSAGTISVLGTAPAPGLRPWGGACCVDGRRTSDRANVQAGSPPRDHPDERRTTHDQSVPLVIGNLPHPQIPCVLHDTPTLPIRPVTNVIEMVLDQPIQVVDLHGKRC
ncbi:MAG: type transport system ATP-binding protein [Acidimicrobiaceae bacterium]|nr:type transport system ATP-binding protein [Acidimicrobiaceae bacterium]